MVKAGYDQIIKDITTRGKTVIGQAYVIFEKNYAQGLIL